MCDTFVALGKCTVDGATIFGKNSDREPNEPHEIVLIPRKKHDEKMVKCTYIEIPQVEETNAVLLSRPIWLWGCEMGANEHGVAIGNEAVFTKKQSKEPRLLGMDLMRLALERGKTASECLKIIVDLIEKFGQGGNAGFESKTYYDNSFLIADPEDAWVLETAGKSWVAERVKDVRSISNTLTIETEWDKSSPDVSKGINFRKKHSDFLYTYFAKGKKRRSTTEGAARRLCGKMDWSDAMEILRIHDPKIKNWTPARGSFRDICVHAGPSLTRPSQTTSSLVCILARDYQVYWFTATAAPCTSIFKPMTFKGGLPDLGPRPSRKYEAGSLWWNHEVLHRLIIRDYPSRIEVLREERDALERSFIEKAKKLIKESADSKSWCEFSEECVKNSIRAEKKWEEKIRGMTIERKPWTKWDKKVNASCGILPAL
ncbi:MAG: C69 family dipeptidase [Candidatus Helarchaeales archaeon]